MMDKLGSIQRLLQFLEQIQGNALCYPQDITAIKNELSQLSFALKADNEYLSNELFRLKDILFAFNGFVNPMACGVIIGMLRLYRERFTSGANDWWKYMHPQLTELCKKKFEDGHYADALETALKELCAIVRDFREKNGLNEIPSDKDMMRNTFSCKDPHLKFNDLSNVSKQNIQAGYENIFSGTIQAMRNPSAHKNIELSEHEAARKLMLASDLMFRLDEALCLQKDSRCFTC